MRGLTLPQFEKCLQSLQLVSPTAMLNQYDRWLSIINDTHKSNLIMSKANQINFKSKADINKLYTIFGKNRYAIAFWLNKCIFPTDLQHYQSTICSSAFDLADVPMSIGFSGTIDNRWVMPNKITWVPCQEDDIKSTNGKMINMILKSTQIYQIPAATGYKKQSKPIWQRFIDKALLQNAGCLIDAGALCVGESMKNKIVPYIALHPDFNHQQFIGITFCDEESRWQVYDIQTKNFKERGTTIPDDKTFVIFDEARARGADLKMNQKVNGALSISPKMTKDKFMQAAGRLRKLGRNQQITVLATKQIIEELNHYQIPSHKNVQPIMKLLAWCCQNTIDENQNLLFHYSNLSWKYVYSKAFGKPYQQPQVLHLDKKYEAVQQTKSILALFQQIQSTKSQNQLKVQTAKFMGQRLKKYGENVHRQAIMLDDSCERQVKQEQKKQKKLVIKIEKPLEDLQTCPENQCQVSIAETIKNLSFSFTKKFQISQNFIETTIPKQPQPDDTFQNELSKCYFVRYNKTSLRLITLRQASYFIKENILKKSQTQDRISLLSDLSILHDFIKQNNLQEQLICAKFIAGYENYSIEEQKYLLQFLLRNQKQNSSKNPDRLSLRQEIVSKILKLRRVYHQKFEGSTLHKLITKLKNQEEFKENNVMIQVA